MRAFGLLYSRDESATVITDEDLVDRLGPISDWLTNQFRPFGWMLMIFGPAILIAAAVALLKGA